MRPTFTPDGSRPAVIRPATMAFSCALIAAFAAGPSPAREAAPVPAQSVTVDSQGTVTANGIEIPVSALLSPEARAQVSARLAHTAPAGTGQPGVEAARAMTDSFLRPLVAKWQALYPAAVRSVTVNGVGTDEVVPDAGIAPQNAGRVLINLHGGGFFTGSGTGGVAEALPLAGAGRIKVIAIDYALAPEHRFPSASQDVEKVYRSLLKTYRPENIGIYGCSAGGTLVAQALAWFQRHDLPRPGAAGIFCSGAMPGFWYGGDSTATAQLLNGRVPATPEQMKASPGNLYLEGVDPNDPLVTPGLFPKVLAGFPPTLLVTSTRDSAMSNALVTNVALLKSGVETQLLVLEGSGHGEFNYLAGTPEASDTYDLIWTFFDRHLGR